MRSAYVVEPAQTALQWYLAARLSIAAGESRFALAVIRKGLHDDPGSARQLLEPHGLCRVDDDWRVVRSIVEELVAETHGHKSYGAALRLQCAVAMRLKDMSLAHESARRLLANPQLMADEQQNLRTWTAGVLAFGGGLSSTAVTALLQGVGSKQLQRRIRLAELLAALKSQEDERVRASWQSLGKDGLASSGDREWKAFALDLALGLMFYEGRNRDPWSNCTLREQARKALHDRLLKTGGAPQDLHLLALLNLSLLGRQRHEPAMPRTIVLICECLGAWAGLLQDDQGLTHFAADRYRRYGKTRPAPSAERIRELMTTRILAALEPYGKACRIAPKRLELMWELECQCVASVAQLGGLDTGWTGDRLDAGPFLASALGLEKAVRERIDRPTNGSRENESPLARLLEIVTQGLVPSVESPVGVEQTRRLFSPLGPAAMLLRRRDFDKVSEEVDRVRRHADGQLPQGDPLLDILSQVLGDGKKRWLRSASRELLAEGYLEASRDLVARVPVPFGQLRETWQSAQSAAKSTAAEAQVRETIAEIGVGRGKALFRRRSRAVRQADSTDKRSNSIRCQEALQLMTLAWDLTAEAKIQGPLAEHLNLQAVSSAKRGDYEAAATALLEALKIKPNARRAADNLANVILSLLNGMFTENPEHAGSRLLEAMEAIRALDRDGREVEIQKCLAKLAEHASTPFFNESVDAIGAREWVTATHMMIWCLRLAPENDYVRRLSYKLEEDLRRQASFGDEAATGCLDRLRKHLRPASAAPLPEVIQRALLELGVVAPDGAQTLNRRAVVAANAGRFDEAITLLTQARQLDPNSTAVRINIAKIREAWMRDAVQTGNIAELMRIRRAMMELAGND